MAALSLEIHRMQTGERLIAEFETIADAEDWLAQRPAFVEVVRVKTNVAPDLEASLRAAMRPLDEQERTFKREQDEAQEAAQRAELARLQAEAEAEAVAARGSPDDLARPMQIHWQRGEPMRIDDATDDREITEAAHRAVVHWLRERDEWVHARRQHVAAATLRVWPASIPTGHESDRVLEADFATLPGFSDTEIT